MKSYAVSIARFGESVNEDAALAQDCLIAVSDGAGGGGVYADEWSQYLLNCLPATPFASFSEMDKWVDGIWEPFYTQHEVSAKQQGGLFLDKFYDEGSFATLVAVWRESPSLCKWISYGDSVAFCYDRITHKLQHSFTRLKDFNLPPYLINTNNPLNEKGFRSGTFDVSNHSIVFATSDALAHYIIMMYRVLEDRHETTEIKDAIDVSSRNSNILLAAKAWEGKSFEVDILNKLLSSSKNKGNFQRHLRSLWKQGVLALDDYSFTLMEEDQ